MHRVVVTGYGMIGPLGLSAKESWQNLVNGQTGVQPITYFDTTDFPITIAAEVKNFNPEDFLTPREIRRQERNQWFAQIAAREAFAQSGLEVTEENSVRIGSSISCAVGALHAMEEQVTNLHTKGPRSVSPFSVPVFMPNAAAGVISIVHGIRGPSFAVVSACASASDGIGVAARFVRSGAVDVMVCGGSEATITPLGIACFNRIGAYSQRTDGTPSPFTRNRDGLVMGEGSGILILESLEHARARGAEILGEVIGHGASADAHHITAPTEDGSGSANAIRMALNDAQINPNEIDYVNAHGTGTQLNDISETLALKMVMQDHAYKMVVSSSKSMTGHLMGATAALEAIFCLQAINEKTVPPTINYHEPDEACDLDYVPNEARQVPIRTAMSNAFGFGGHNSVLIFRAFED